MSRQAADYLRWAHRRRLTSRLTVTHQPRQDPDIVMSDDERWELLSRCLHDTTMPLEIRAAGALVLLYGLPVTKIVELTRDHLHRTSADDGGSPDGLRVTLSSPVIAVPPALGRILTLLPAQRAGAVPLIEPDENEPAWLLPGRNPRVVRRTASTSAGGDKELILWADSDEPGASPGLVSRYWVLDWTVSVSSSW